MSVTIYDVAKKAGVGIGTVSRAINNSPNISPETKNRVEEAIKVLNYQPHAMAQGLASKRTKFIAIVVPFFTGYFYHELLRGIQNEISKHHYDIILYNVDQTEKTEIFLKRTLQERKVDGVLLISLQISDKYVQKFIKTNFPIVLVDSENNHLDSLIIENEKGAYKATEHLIRLGHKKIAMIDAQLKSTPAKYRLKGYKRALKEHHIPFRNKYLIICDSDMELDGFNREAGYHAMKQLLNLDEEDPTAVFISSDIQAAGGIKAIREAGLHIPGDISVVGFDDIEMAEFLDLTTMRQPMYEIGQLGAKRLIDKIEGKATDKLHRHFDTELIIRESSGLKRYKSKNIKI